MRLRRRRRAGRCCSPRTRRTPHRLYGADDGRLLQGRDHDHVVDGDADAVNPGRTRHEGGGALPPHRRRRAARSVLRLRFRAAGRAAATPFADFDAVFADAHRRGRRVLRRAAGATSPSRRARSCSARRSPADLVEAVLHYDVRAGSTATRPSRPRRRSAQGRAQRRLAAPRQRRRHLDAGQVGVPLVRLLGPRASTASPLATDRPGVRQGPAAAAARANGTCTRTGSCRPTSGTSPT